MNNSVREILIRLINENSMALCDDTRRLKSFLKDLCADCPREINVLVNALEIKIHEDLSNAPNDEQTSSVKRRLSQRLQNSYAMTKDAADWAVETWSYVFNNKNAYPPDLPDEFPNPPSIIIDSEQGHLPLFKEPKLKPEESIYSFSGHKNTKMEFVALDKGLYVFEITHEGRDNFYVQLCETKGDFFKMLANEIGRANISKAVAVTENKIFSLEIEADGKWNIKVKYIAPAGKKNKNRLAGIGQQATCPVNLQRQSKLFISHQGSNNFIVELLDLEGNFVDLLVNDVGKCELNKRVNLHQSGPYLFDIKADGKWKIKIS